MKMPRRLRLILVAVIVTALLAVALWPAARLVDTATVDVGLVRQTIEAEGRTRLKDRYEITAPLAATARRLELEPGDRIAVCGSFHAVGPALEWLGVYFAPQSD